MNVCVINGSPKGPNSVTLQTALYLEKRFPSSEFRYLHAGQRIKALEKDMGDALATLAWADLLLFCYPVYTFLAPSQLHRAIELIKESGVDLRGKYAAQITTSKHFFDVTAHRYVEDNCLDLGLRYIGGLSADMEDLLTERGQEDAAAFWRYATHRMARGVCETARPEVRPTPEYAASLPPTQKKNGFEVVIVTNAAPEDTSLRAMIDDFRAALPYPTRVENIAEYPFAGGCIGCFHCASDGTCVYKDGFDRYLRQTIQTADAIVYAFTIRDHSMGASFKRYDDRQFCNGHRTVTMGMPMGYLARGDFAAEPNLRAVIEGRAEVGHNFLAGVATDKEGIISLADTLAYALENKLVLPRNFYGVGGMKIFRDLIWQMRGLMRADHLFYKAHGVYDFPQKHPLKMVKMLLIGKLMRNPKAVKKMGAKISEGMIAPYKKAIARGEGEKRGK